MSNRIDYVKGQKLHPDSRLMFLRDIDSPICVTRRALFSCDCGGKTEKNINDVKSGRTKSCGCLWREVKITHGREGEPLYRVWSSMKNRCSNPNNNGFDNYGGRGITVCKRWNDSFENFATDMGECPKGFTLDRTDNDGDYTSENCTWATYEYQNRNRRVSKRNIIGVTGVTKVKGSNKWKVAISAYNTTFYIGTFSILEHAISARKYAELKYWSEYMNRKNK